MDGEPSIHSTTASRPAYDGRSALDDSASPESRVLLWTPGAAESLCQALHAIGLRSEACPSIDALCHAVEAGVGVVVLDADRLTAADCRCLQQTLAGQPSWSDLPLILLTTRPDARIASQARDRDGASWNALELFRATPANAVAVATQFALRARQWQYALRDQAAETVQVEQRERQRLAHLLHDHLQQLLVAARIKVSAIDRRQERADFRDAFREADELLGQALEVSRTLAVELCPPQLHEAGLVGALEWLARHAQQRHGMRVDVDIEPELKIPFAELDASQCDLTAVVFQTVRELLFNVVKHAHVDEARILLHHGTADTICITVADDGAGFDPAILQRQPASGCGFGLPNFRRRLQSVGARLEIASVLGHGTRATVTIPAASARP